MKAVGEKFGDDIHPGDIFLHNDPYTGGTHLNDVAMIYPLFADGSLFVFPVVRAHWGDVGGMSPGSLSGNATEIFQEGVRIPPIRIVDRGRPNQAVLDVIFGNMRGPRERQGDFQAMIGTCKKAAERIEGLAVRYGAATIRSAIAVLMDRAETRMRQAIAALPDGRYRYEAHLESGRERLEPLTVRAAGDHKGGGNHCYVGGPDPRTGETFIFYEYPAGGTGGFEGGDGNNAVRTWTESDMTTLQPIEAVEQLYPLRVERTALRDDSGGAGRWRGGLGLVREVRIHAPASQLSVLAERAVLPPFGVCGGGAGATNRFWVRRNDQPIQPSALPGKISGFPIQPEDLLIMESSGGGGFGDALDRDLESVARDLAEGYVSPAAAEARYGVVSRAGVIDAAATAARRASLREARIRVRLATGRDLDEGRGRAIRLDADTAARLGVGLQAVVELVNPQGAPLRARVARSVPGAMRRAELSRDGLPMLALSDGVEVEIRAVHSGFLVAPR